MEPWKPPLPIDYELWSRPCAKCKRRIDQCVCKEGPTGYGRATNDGGGFDKAAIEKALRRIK